MLPVCRSWFLGLPCDAVLASPMTLAKACLTGQLGHVCSHAVDRELCGKSLHYISQSSSCLSLNRIGINAGARPAQAVESSSIAAASGSTPASCGTGKDAATGAADSTGDVAYDSYDPLVLQQAASQEMRRFESFDAALDEFYSKVHPTGLLPITYMLIGMYTPRTAILSGMTGAARPAFRTTFTL